VRLQSKRELLAALAREPAIEGEVRDTRVALF